MYPITNAVKALFDAEQRQVLRITGTDRNGTAITITEANVMEGGFNIDRYSCNSSRLEIGTAIAAEMTLKLDNRQGQFDNVIFEGTELFVEVGIADWTQSNPTVTYVPCGYFTPDEQPRRLSTISLNALDRMTRFDQAQPAMVPWTDNHGNKITDNKSNIIYFAAALEFPMTIAQIVQYLCNICDVPLGTDLTQMPGYDYIITELPDLSGEMTARNIIQWSAGIMASNAWVDWSGKLRFSWFNNTTGYTTTTANRFDSDMYENDVVITGVQWVDSDDERTVYLSGTNDYVLDLSDNALIDSTIAADVINDVYSVVHGFAYRPFKATVVPAPYLWPMDRVTFTDKNGSGHVSIITNVNFTINGSSVIAANGETSQTNSMAQPSGFTAEQLQLLRKIRRTNATDMNNAIDSATNFITGADGGFIRFIYDDEDNLSEIIIMDTNDIATATKVWRFNSGGLGYSENGYAGPYNLAMTQDGAIVADFITAGVMSANVMRAGILTDITGTNFWDLDNGVFRLAGNTTLDGRPITQLLTDIDATISSVEIQFAQNQSQTIAPTDGWSTEAPSWASGYYIWQRTVTTSPSGVTYSDPTCISGRDGSESTPGLNQATIYLYQRSEETPASPDINTAYTFVNGTLAPLPTGWTRSIPTGSEPCWCVSASAISTDTTDIIAPSDWSTPVMMFENGENGSSVESVVDYYAISSTTMPPADTEFWTPGVPVLWMDNFGNVITAGSSGNIEFMPPAVPVPTLIDPYVWQYQLTTYTDGTTSKSNKHLTAILGDSGVGITDLTVEYYLSASNTEQIFGEWTTEQPQWVRGYYIWTRTVITWTDGKTTTTEPVLAQSINLANETADNAVGIANQAIDNTNNLDASLNQTGVFNRLTNNGLVQGIYLENNQLYINGTYIKSGTIDAGLIAAGSLTINQLDGAAKSAIVTGVTVKTQYYLSNSADEATGGTWTDAVPEWSAGKYAWTRDVTTKTYADGTTVTTNGNGVYDANLTTALSTSASASSAASVAQTTADSASTAASNAQSTANSAASAASAAQSTANSAVNAASTAQSTANSAVTAAATAQSTANSKITTFFQPSAPSAMTVGDLWIDTDAGNKLYRWNGVTWVSVQDAEIQTALSNAASAAATADKKIVTFAQASQPTATSVGDLWIDTDAGNKLYRWSGVAWVNAQDSAIAAAANLAAQAQSAADNAIVSTVSVYYRSTTNTTPSISSSTTIGTSVDTSNTWTYVLPRPKNGCYFYTCEQYTYGSGNIDYSPVRSIANANYTSLWCSANDATYIDGAHIYAGSVTADQIAAGTLTVATLSGAAQKALASNSSSKMQYYLSDSSASATGGTWQDTVPTTWVAGKYVWTRVVTTVTKADGTTSVSYSAGVYDWNTTYALSTSASATTAANNAQNTANGAVSTVISKNQYYLSTSDSWTTGGTWQDTVPEWVDGMYVWTRVATTITPVSGTATTRYSDGIYSVNLTTALSTAADASIAADDAKQAVNSATDSVSAKYQYYLSTSSSSPVGGEWQDTVPEWNNGKYIFTRIATTTTSVGGVVSDPVYSGAVYDKNLTNALTTAAFASSIANGAAYREQIIYISKSSATSSQPAITTWVTDTSGDQNKWTTNRPVYNGNYPVLFTAVQRQTMAQSSGYTCSCTAPVVDQTTTVIDGGHISTGTIDAGVVNVTNINADNITGGTIDGTQVNAKLLNIVDANNNVLASYADVITIGKTTKTHAEFDYNSFELYDVGQAFLSLGDMRNTSGIASVVEKFVGDGTTKEFRLVDIPRTVSRVTINGVQTTAYTTTGNTNVIIFTNAPIAGSNIEVYYDTSSPVYHYDLGVRKSGEYVGKYSLVEGYLGSASGAYSHAEGFSTTASNYSSHAEGQQTTASGNYSHAEGLRATAFGNVSHAEGYVTTASGNYSHAEGYQTTASGAFSHAEGSDSIASMSYSHAEGYGTTASGNYSHAEGLRATAFGNVSHAEGASRASGQYSHAEGGSTANGDYSHSEGRGTAVEPYSHAEGTSTASGQFSHAEGQSIASGTLSHAESSGTASGDSSHAEGSGSASGDSSHAEGSGSAASGTCSHAEGSSTTAQGNYGHAEGYGASADGNSSHSEGYWTNAFGDYSHAEGRLTSATGECAHAEGRQTEAYGLYSHAEGYGTIAKVYCQHVVGFFNIADETTQLIEIVGNGTSNVARTNARTLNLNGNEWIAGRLTQASDNRLKTESGEVPDMSAIPARRFKWNDNKVNHDDKEHLGYFAQDVEAVAPYLVDEDAMGYKSLDYIGVLVAKIASLEKRVAELENASKTTR